MIDFVMMPPRMKTRISHKKRFLGKKKEKENCSGLTEVVLHVL